MNKESIGLRRNRHRQYTGVGSKYAAIDAHHGWGNGTGVGGVGEGRGVDCVWVLYVEAHAGGVVSAAAILGGLRCCYCRFSQSM